MAEHPDPQLVVEALSETPRVADTSATERSRHENRNDIHDGGGYQHVASTLPHPVVDTDLGQDGPHLQCNRLDQYQHDCCGQPEPVRPQEPDQGERSPVPLVVPPRDLRDLVGRFMLEDLDDLLPQVAGYVRVGETRGRVGLNRSGSTASWTESTADREHQRIPV